MHQGFFNNLDRTILRDIDAMSLGLSLRRLNILHVKAGLGVFAGVRYASMR